MAISAYEAARLTKEVAGKRQLVPTDTEGLTQGEGVSGELEGDSRLDMDSSSLTLGSLLSEPTSAIDLSSDNQNRRRLAGRTLTSKFDGSSGNLPIEKITASRLIIAGLTSGHIGILVAIGAVVFSQVSEFSSQMVDLAKSISQLSIPETVGLIILTTAVLFLLCPFGWVTWRAAGWRLENDRLVLRFRRLARITLFCSFSGCKKHSFKQNPFQSRGGLADIEVKIGTGGFTHGTARVRHLDSSAVWDLCKHLNVANCVTALCRFLTSVERLVRAVMGGYLSNRLT